MEGIRVSACVLYRNGEKYGVYPSLAFAKAVVRTTFGEHDTASYRDYVVNKYFLENLIEDDLSDEAFESWQRQAEIVKNDAPQASLKARS